MLIAGAGNYVYNFYPDLKKYGIEKEFYFNIAEELSDLGIECIFIDNVTHPFVAACSNDEIVSFKVKYDYTMESGHLFKKNPYFVDTDLLGKFNSSNSCLVLSDSVYDDVLKSSDYLLNAGEAFENAFTENTELILIRESPYSRVYVYRYNDSILDF